PTQVSHDGIASPIAVISHPSAGVTSLGATAPEAVIVSVATVLSAPERTIRAGVGDLLGKVTALYDWRLAVDAGAEKFDDYAALLAEVTTDYAYSYLLNVPRARVRDRDFVLFLVRSLIMSGVAMTIAGSSRPCSGSEHLISHAIDTVFGGRALHGEQVAVGTVAALAIQGRPDEARRLAMIYRRLGLPTSHIDIGLTDAEFLAALREAPRTRPGRYTVLDRLLDTRQVAQDVLSTLKEAVGDA
ncbi:MAG: iron-containing alcohol dehydrogenase, partial [Anaerolineae bacterium]|nr:iron-containing alcohol dehydrogenase [Anaerolineae bacterium]